LVTIYTCAAYTTAHDICEGGKERTQALLDKLGLGLNDWGSMQLIMRNLGLSDTLFSFCKVKKGCEQEAQQVLGQYMLQVTGDALNLIALTRPDIVSELVRANKAINKRCINIRRPELLAQEYNHINRLHANEAEVNIRHWLDVYRCMLSDKPDHLAATHASIALMDGAGIIGIRDQMHKHLCATLNRLLGDEE
jgi:hypothetical protein